MSLDTNIYTLSPNNSLVSANLETVLFSEPFYHKVHLIGYAFIDLSKNELFILNYMHLKIISARRCNMAQDKFNIDARNAQKKITAQGFSRDLDMHHINKYK